MAKVTKMKGSKDKGSPQIIPTTSSQYLQTGINIYILFKILINFIRVGLV